VTADAEEGEKPIWLAATITIAINVRVMAVILCLISGT
jgi:hypothetical protein